MKQIFILYEGLNKHGRYDYQNTEKYFIYIYTFKLNLH